MAVLPSNKPWGIIDDYNREINVTTEDYAIGGKMITAKIAFDPATFNQMMTEADWRKYIRESLVQQLARVILDSNLVETTTYNDPSSSRQQVAARCYLTPDSQVKILRVHKR